MALINADKEKTDLTFMAGAYEPGQHVFTPIRVPSGVTALMLTFNRAQWDKPTTTIAAEIQLSAAIGEPWETLGRVMSHGGIQNNITDPTEPPAQTALRVYVSPKRPLYCRVLVDIDGEAAQTTARLTMT